MKANDLIIFNHGVGMIKYHNNLNKIALTDFNQRELSIFFTACSIMKEQGTNELEISFLELEKLIGISFKDKNELVKYVKSLSDKLLKLKTNIENDGLYITFVLFRTFVIDTNRNMLTIKVNEDFAYILNDLTRNFTLFELQEFNALGSTYAKHLYRMLKQFKYTGYFKIEISEFRRLLDIPEKYRMCDINKRVLAPAINEVSNFFSSLNLNKIKEGRNIKYLEFTFDKERRSTEIEEPVIDLNLSQITPAEVSSNNDDNIVLCPRCGQVLSKCTSRSGDTFWGHKNYLTSECKATYSTIEEIESDREKRINLIENEADREKFEKDVIELINQNKDVIKLHKIESKFVYIEQVEQKDLFYNNPVVQVKIDKNAINVIKSCIDEWSK